MQIVKRSLLWMLTAAVPVVIAACYGMPVSYGAFQQTGKVVDKESQEAIPGIEVSCETEAGALASSDVTTTDDLGAFTISFDSCPVMVFEDNDGGDNGGTFQRLEVPLTEAEWVEDLAQVVELEKELNP